jgi:alanine racemase
LVKCEGIWSHLARADEPENPAAVQTTLDQHQKFEEFIELVENTGLTPKYKHIAASAGILLHPEMHYNMVRAGIILYGLSPNPDQIDAAEYGLQPCMTVYSQLNNVKQVAKGAGISYGHEYHVASQGYADQRNYIGIVPLGYADGIPRACGSSDHKEGAPILVTAGDEVAHIAGRVCMDQFVVDLGGKTSAKAGDEVVLFGSNPGDPSVDDWARAAGTISYEILTRILYCAHWA